MTKGLSAERLAEIAGRVAEATPGKWFVLPDHYYANRGWKTILAGRQSVVLTDGFTRHRDGETEEHYGVRISDADAALIANAPADLADLLAEVERLGLIERSVRRLLAMKQESTRPEDQAIYNTLHGLLTKADAISTARTPEATP